MTPTEIFAYCILSFFIGMALTVGLILLGELIERAKKR